jgi:hypothetical protein
MLFRKTGLVAVIFIVLFVWNVINSSVDIATAYCWTVGNEIFLYSTLSRPALGPTPTPIQWIAGALFPFESGWDVKLTTQLHLKLKSKMVDQNSTPPHVIMV